MFPDLNNFLDVDVGHLPMGKCILTVEISGANGSFVLHHFLSLALRGETTVCFLGLAQTFHHYTCVGNKLALNLSRLRDSGKLTFVDVLSLIGSDFVKLSVTTPVPDQTGNKLCYASFQYISWLCLQYSLLLQYGSPIHTCNPNPKLTVTQNAIAILTWSSQTHIRRSRSLRTYLCYF